MDQANPVPPLQHIFVSYSRADSETVDAIVSRLKRDGFDVWLDREAIMGGDIWSQEIVKAVGNAYAFLLMLSPSAAASKNVRQEVCLAFGGDKDLVPLKLAPVEIPDSLQYQLAGVQWIEYYRNPDAKYAELVNVLNHRKPGSTPTMLAVAFVLQGLNRFNREKQAQLLDSIADFTGTPRAAFEITKPIDMGGHIVVKMPADAAYHLKTAALNSDMRLLRHGIKGLRLTGDRDFVLVKSGRFAPLKSGNLAAGLTAGGWIAGGLASAAVGILLLYLLLRPDKPGSSPPVVELTVTATPAATATVANTFTPRPTITIPPQAPTDVGPDLADFPDGISPLTGLPACDPSLLEFPAVLVSISHFPAEGRPESGLSFSSMVFEMYIGTGATRFLAVFYGDCPNATAPGVLDQIGPVRSGRLPYRYVREFFQGSCLAFASADDPTFKVLPVCKIVYGADVISAFLSVADLNQIAREKTRRDRPFNYSGNMFSDIAPAGEVSMAENISIFYKYLNQGQWRYDAASGKYLRSVNGTREEEANQFTPATDRLTGEQLAFSNVIVMLAEHRVERLDAIDINMAINSFGNAYLFRDGKVFKIHWTATNEEYEQESGLRRPIRFRDLDGNPIPLKPGNTWIHLMSPWSQIKLSGDTGEVRFGALVEI
jgi:hypothetical protein